MAPPTTVDIMDDLLGHYRVIAFSGMRGFRDCTKPGLDGRDKPGHNLRF
jgi:hypothetical protein